MSSDRSASTNQARPVKPTLASSRTARTPLAPRLAVNATHTLPAPLRRTPTARSEPPPATTPRPRQPQIRQEETPNKDAFGPGSGPTNITPRSSARRSRVESTNSSPSQAGDSPNPLKLRISGVSASAHGERNGGVAGVGAGHSQGRPPTSVPKSFVGDGGSYRAHSPQVRSPCMSDIGHPPTEDSIDSHFFHASDVSKQEPAPKKPSVKKAPTFFYADGQQDERPGGSSRATSPVMSALSEQRSSGLWARTDSGANPSKGGALLSPGLNSLPASSPFFAPPSQVTKSRSPSPSKDNIHLSYRKGASQIFGSRPSPVSLPQAAETPLPEPETRRVSSESKFFQTPHRKTPSLSSIDSGSSQKPRRRSATTLDPATLAPSPLSLEAKSATLHKLTRPPSNLPSIDTAYDASSIHPSANSAMSPTKGAAELASDARRERKVLDLEISNSSLLAINSSLEREVRRQKAELKRFRRLSRAGTFSIAQNERTARFSEGLSVLGEEDEDADYAKFGPPSGFTEVYDDFSEDDYDDETESVASGGDPLSPSAQQSRQNDRLAKDEKRLRVDLEKHKELLVQSQMMNQTLKRCTFATEAMIKDGRKALAYNVRVSDIKLGGRILTGHEDEEDDGVEEHGPEIEIEDEILHGVEAADEQARGFLDMWQGLGGEPRQSFEGSEGGDRDSGIEVDKPSQRSALTGLRILDLNSGRPPDGQLLSPGHGEAHVRPNVHWTNTIS